MRASIPSQSSSKGGARARSALLAFLCDKRGGAMLFSGMTAIGVLTSVGAMMTNLAWEEAQMEELRSAMRAAVSSVSQLLPRVTDATTQTLIQARIAQFLKGAVDGLSVDQDDVTITHDAGTRVTTVTVGGQADYTVDKVWGGGSQSGAVALEQQTVSVTVDISRYEIAVAADITRSMLGSFSSGEGDEQTVKMAALRAAVDAAIDILENRNEETTGSMSMALIPFGHLVNVADTSGDGETDGKKRYAHMLGGAAVGGGAATTGHWVDTFHQYGAGADMGELFEQDLPIFETPADWDLRQTMALDVSSQSSLGTWNANGDDFWNGCVMARWGAYWDEDARPTGWDADAPAASNWPARDDVDAWTTASAALTNEPLHLSDAPPDNDDANTRFTAFSYPDSRIAGPADAAMEAVLYETLEPDGISSTWISGTLPVMKADNSWGQRGTTAFAAFNTTGSDGSSGCPPNAVQPLSDTVATLRASASALATVERYQGFGGGTYPHLGIVWGLRAVSPLWRDVWDVEDATGVARPLTPCADGETSSDCEADVKKIILLVTDGDASQTNLGPGAVAAGDALRNPTSRDLCRNFELLDEDADYADIYKTRDAATFNDKFELDADGTFTGDKLEPLVNALVRVVDDSATATVRQGWATALSGKTPWEVFRGPSSFADDLAAADIALGGRPVLDGYGCYISSNFGAYGRVGAKVQVGGEPIAGVAPLAAVPGDTSATRTQVENTLNGWFDDACALAGDRGVEIRAIYIGQTTGWHQPNIAALRRCVTAAGGTSDDVQVTPSADQLERAFESVFTVSRQLRFVG